MWAMNRINRMGIQYFMVEVPATNGMMGRTQIRTKDKSIIVDHSIQRVSEAWYEWMVSGKFVQEAFNFFTPAEREFIITGMTPEDWNKVFDPTTLDSNEGDN